MRRLASSRVEFVGVTQGDVIEGGLGALERTLNNGLSIVVVDDAENGPVLFALTRQEFARWTERRASPSGSGHN